MSPERARTARQGESANAGVQSVDRALRLLKAVAAAGSSIKKLGAATGHSAKYNKAAPKFVDYYNANC